MKNLIKKFNEKMDDMHPLLMVMIVLTTILVVSIICKLCNIPLPLGTRMVWFNTKDVPFIDVFSSVFVVLGLLCNVCIIIGFIVMIITNNINNNKK